MCRNTYPPGQTGPVLNTYLHKPKNLFTKETGTAPKASARAPLCCKSKKQKMLRHQRSQQAQPPRLCLHTTPEPLAVVVGKTWEAFPPCYKHMGLFCCLSPFVIWNNINLGFFLECVCEKKYSKPQGLRIVCFCLLLQSFINF